MTTFVVCDFLGCLVVSGSGKTGVLLFCGRWRRARCLRRVMC